MDINVYLSFNGNCEQAFRFYEKALGGKIEAIYPYEGSPAAAQVPKDMVKKIMHARVTVPGGGTLMGSDACGPDGYQKPQGFTVSLNVEKPADAERFSRALSESGTTKMPMQETFWAARFGMCVDRFGIPWMVNCEAGKN